VRVHKGTAVIVGAAVLALGLAACSSSKSSGSSGSSGSSAKPTGSLVFGESTDFPENFMPLISAGNATSTANIEGRVLNGAFRSAPDISFQTDPDQITSATSSLVNGQQVVDIKINPKAIWADGQPITANDYIFTWQDQKSSDPAKGGCAALLSTTGFNQIESGTAVSDKEVKFTFINGQPYSDWKALFSGPSGFILSKHIMDKGSPTANCAYITAGWPIAGGIPLGAQNGPWMLQASGVDAKDKVVTLQPNPKYWGAQPKLARIVYDNIGSDSDTNVKALQNNEVNMIYPQPQLDLVANLKKLTNVNTTINFGVDFEHLDFNTKDALLAHPEVRQAIAYAIDRKSLVSATVGQFSDKASVLGNRLLVTNQTGYVDNSGPYNSQDVAKAKSLLEGIGAKMGSDGYYSLNGKELSFTVITTQNNPLRDQTITNLAQQVKAAGIKLTESADADIFGDTSKPASLAAEGFQIALFAWVGTPAISSNNAIYQSPAVSGANGQNYSQGSDSAVDAQLQKLATATTSSDEIAAANAADKLLWNDMFTLPLYQKPTLLAYDNKYKGIADNATSAGPLWNSDLFTAS
jgi:peptide/nickel transport system substrate-binding protein